MNASLSTLCYIEKEGKYLMLHRTVKKNDVNKDKRLHTDELCVPGIGDICLRRRGDRVYVPLYSGRFHRRTP